MSQVAEIIDLLKQGHTPAEIKRQGYSHSLVSHASGAYKYAQRELFAKSNTPASAVDDPPVVTRKPRQGKLRSSGSDSVNDKPGMLMVGGRDSQAEALLLQSKAMRLPMPELLPMAMTAARREWNWSEDMSVSDFIDTIIWHFFAAKGIFLGTYYKLEDMEQLIAEAKEEGNGASPLSEPEIGDGEWVLQREGEPGDDVVPDDDLSIPLQDEIIPVMDEVTFEPQDEPNQELDELISASGKGLMVTTSDNEGASEEEDSIDDDIAPDVVTIKDILMAKG